VTLAVGASAFWLTGRRDAWLDPAVRRLLTIIPDHTAASVVGAAAVPVVAQQGGEELVDGLSADLDLSLEQIAQASSQDLGARLASAIKRDSDRGMIAMLDGWIVPRALARLCALATIASA
jgi:hypothetical protein